MALANKSVRSKALLNMLCTRKDGYKSLVEGLKIAKQSGAVELLQTPIHVKSSQHDTAGSSSSQLTQMQISAPCANDLEILPFKQIPFQSKEAAQLFTGRGSELRVLLESLLPDGGTASITGIGGIGKTELAKMFLQKLDEEEHESVFKQIIWINCESSFSAATDFTTIAQDYLKVPTFNSSGQQRKITSILNDIYEKLHKSKSLIILDNVETTEILQTFLPKTSKKSKLSILVTTQSIKYETRIPLDGLDLTEAVEFVKKGLNLGGPLSKEFDNGILELVIRLEKLPLAISQAIGYIQDKGKVYSIYGPYDYLDDLDRIPDRIFDKNSFSDLSSNGKTIYRTLDLSLSRIEACQSSGMLASKILSKVAFMAPDNIPSSLFSKLTDSVMDTIEEALILIQRFSIIKFMPVKRKCTVYFSIHRLVQDVLRIRIDQNNQTESRIHSTIVLLNCHLNDELTNHSLEAWKHASKIQNLVELFSEFPIGVTLQMKQMGRISDAYDFSKSSLILLKQKLSIKEHANTIFRLQGYNKYLLFLQGKLDKSLQKLEATLDEAKQFLPEDNKVIFKIRYYLADLYCVIGQNDKSALICDKMCEDYKLHKTVPLRTLFDVGQLQSFLERFEDAQKTTKFILEHLDLHSEEDREKLEFDTKRLLAEIHGDMGNYRECLTLYTEILQTFMKDQINKFSNFDRWVLFHNMGLYQYRAGLFEEAHDSFQKALNEMNGLKDSDSATILQTKCMIARVMLVRNMVDEALVFSKEVYEQMKEIFGESSYWTFISLANIGVAYSKIGRHDDAVEILTQVIENDKYKTMLGKYCLALSLEKIGSFDRSVEILSGLRIRCLQKLNYKVFTIEQVDSALNRIHQTRNKKLVLSKVYKFNKLY